MANPRKEITGSRQRTFLAACPANYVWIPQHASCRAAVHELVLFAAARKRHRQHNDSNGYRNEWRPRANVICAPLNLNHRMLQCAQLVVAAAWSSDKHRT